MKNKHRFVLVLLITSILNIGLASFLADGEFYNSAWKTSPSYYLLVLHPYLLSLAYFVFSKKLKPTLVILFFVSLFSILIFWYGLKINNWIPFSIKMHFVVSALGFILAVPKKISSGSTKHKFFS